MGLASPKQTLRSLRSVQSCIHSKEDVIDVTEAPTFHRYIQPQIVPTLTRFCKRLTGITQEQVDNGVSFNEMTLQWTDFLAKHDCTTDKVLFASWTDFDIKQLRREVTRSSSTLEFSTFDRLAKSIQNDAKK